MTGRSPARLLAPLALVVCAVALYAVITSTSALYDFSSDSIFDIVREQSQAYFSGQKTAEDVAKLVQSKANIYVNEQR